MNTSLAQSLVDAGFPRKFHRTAQTLIDPTLTELVDQCVALSPNGHFNLERRLDGAWAASIEANTMKSWGDGDSADDAAAKLWLVMGAKKAHPESGCRATSRNGE